MKKEDFISLLSSSEVSDVHGYTMVTGYNKEQFPCIYMFRPRAQKPFIRYKFKDLEKLIEYAVEQVKWIKEEFDTKMAEKEKAKLYNVADHFKVGDIVYNSWGYEQTNIEFYQVIAIKGKSQIRVKAIASKQVEGSMMAHGMACNVVADKDNFLEGDWKREYTLTVKYKDWAKEGHICAPESYYYFAKWDGQEKYQSWYY